MKTDASNAVFIPVVNVMDKAKINNNKPLSLANKDVLKPINKQRAKSISATVERSDKTGISN